MNDRIALPKKTGQNFFYLNFFSSNSCNFITGSDQTQNFLENVQLTSQFLAYDKSFMPATDKAKFDCPTGYVICKNLSSELKLYALKTTFAEAQIHCDHLNSTICK